MTFQDAAAMLMNFVVAYGLVFDTACVRQGQTVLIHSAGGGVVSNRFLAFHMHEISAIM